MKNGVSRHYKVSKVVNWLPSRYVVSPLCFAFKIRKQKKSHLTEKVFTLSTGLLSIALKIPYIRKFQKSNASGYNHIVLRSYIGRYVLGIYKETKYNN